MCAQAKKFKLCRWSGALVWIGLATLIAVAAVVMVVLGGNLPVGIRSGVLFYLPLLWAALILTPAISAVAPVLEVMARRLSCRLIMLVLTVFYALLGLYWTQSIGAHSGDEGHYLVQAESLYEDGDLDIRDNLERGIGAEAVDRIGRDTFHVSPFSRGAHWYSFHAAGLPLILAPFVPGGAVARHLVLGLIVALTVCAVWRLCRRAGASIGAAFFVGAGFFGSLYGMVYAVRCLPEMLGACLIAWLCWAICVQADWPWRSALVGAFCCALLPWAYLRFYPAALLGVFLYVLFGLRAFESGLRRSLRLLCFVFLSAGGILYYHYIQNLMYDGGWAHPVGDVLFSHPRGLWLIFTNPHAGLLNVFPLAIGLVAAAIAFPLVAPTQRRMAFVVSAFFGVIWLTSCSGFNYFGGATLGGRFLFAVLPLLLPGLAVLWDHVAGPARFWLVFLALVSVALGVLELIYLPQLGKTFVFPYQGLPVVAPLLEGLPQPFGGMVPAVLAGLLTLGLFGLCRRRSSVVFVLEKERRL